MSYIAFDLDALNVSRDVGAAAGVPEERITHGLLRMWAWCFREKTDTVQAIQVQGFFGTAAAPALVAFGFLAPAGADFRVRGAERYLRISEARSRGGKAAAGNLIPGGPKRSASPDPSRGSLSAPAEPQPSDTLGSTSALTPSTEHRAPNTKETTLVEQAPLLSVPAKPRLKPMALDDKMLTDDEWAVFDHWRVECQHPKALLDTKRLSLIRRWLATPGITVLRLQKAITGCAKSAWHRGQNPSRKRYDDLELILRDAKQLEQFEGAAA